jgi:hypothetical protein
MQKQYLEEISEEMVARGFMTLEEKKKLLKEAYTSAIRINIQNINSRSAKLPVGFILAWSGKDESKIPEGYMVCDGSYLRARDYYELYSVMKFTYGKLSGMKHTHFRLPDSKTLNCPEGAIMLIRVK